MNNITRFTLVACLSACFSTLAFPQSTAYVVTTLAGQNRSIGDGGPALASLLNQPTALTSDGLGNFYVADSFDFRIRKIDSAGKISTVAGNGTFGYSGDGGAATAASIGLVYGVAADTKGNVYFSDFLNCVVRMVTPGGKITTVAGNGNIGFSGDQGPATAATFFAPIGVAVDPAGNLYIADSFNDRVRMVTPSGTVSTYAGSGVYSVTRGTGPAVQLPLGDPEGLAFDAAGNLYVTSNTYSVIMKITPGNTMSLYAGNGYSGFSSGDGGLAPLAYFYGPNGLAFDAAGNCYIAEGGTHILRKINAGGSVSTVAGLNAKLGFAGDGGPSGMAQFLGPYGIAVDSAGNVLIADRSNNRIRRVNIETFTIATMAGGQTPLGDGGPATSGQFLQPSTITTDSTGNLYVADGLDQRVRKISSAGVISTVAGSGVPGYSGDTGLATSAQLLSPAGVTPDSFGALFIADSGNSVIRKVTANGNIQTIAGIGSYNFAGDNGPAAKAALTTPICVRTDIAGNIFFVDADANRIRKINAITGTIATVAGSNGKGLGDGGPATAAALSGPSCVFIDAANNLFISDKGNHRIRKVDAVSGIITTIAGTGKKGFNGDGGLATNATLSSPSDVVTDAVGNVYIADTSNGRIRKIAINGILTTIAGNGNLGFTGDGAVATAAQIGFVQGMAIDPSGAIYFSDAYNNRIRKLTLQSIAAPDFTFASDSTVKSVAAGASVAFVLTLASQNGFSSGVGLAATGLNTGSVIFSPTSPVSVPAGQTVVVTATVSIPAGTAAGTQNIGFIANSLSLSHSLPATLSITAGTVTGPVISSAGIANAASFAGGAVSPGEVVTLYGSGMGPASLVTLSIDPDGNVTKALAGTVVTFSNIPAPLIYTSAGQVSAIVPYGVAAGSSATVQVTYNGVASNTTSIAVTDASPALFTYNSSGSGAADVLNQDNSVNTPANAAARGTVITLFGTGEGLTSPDGVDGQVAVAVYPKPVLPVTVTIGGIPATVAYAGAAPGDVAGIVQINVTVPPEAATGQAVPVVFTVGTKTSPAGVTVAIQ